MAATLPLEPVTMFFFDPLYLVFVVVILVITGAAQLYVASTFRRWNGVRNSQGLTGGQIAQGLANFNARSGNPARTRMAGLRFAISPGDLSDHFDPLSGTIGLSQVVANTPSVAAMAVAAHEMGHAQQHADGSALMAARRVLVPAVQFSPLLSYFLILLGLWFNLTGLFTLGILVFGLVVLFSLLTLPIEIDASRRGLAMLDASGATVTEQDRAGAQAVLRAAALTYLAAAITAILQLLYYLTIARRGG